MKLKTIQVVSIVVIIGLALLSGVLACQYQNLKTVYEKLSSDFDALSKEHKSLQTSYSNLQGNYTALSKNFSDLQQNYYYLNRSFTILSLNYSSLRQTYRQAVSRIANLESQVSSLQGQLLDVQNQLSSLQNSYASLQKNYTTLLASYSALQISYTSLNASYTDALKKISDLQSQLSNLSNLSSQLQALQAQYNALKSQYDALLVQYNAVLSGQSIYIGTTLETYCQYVRSNYYSLLGFSIDEANWRNYFTSSSYASISVKFAAGLASHDIGNFYWPTLESGCNYYTYAGEYSYQTSSRIMQRTISIAGISYSDSSVTKIQKVLAFIHSLVHYETRLLDHMWFPTETLTFRSGDCTGFSILSSAMFEAAGIKSAVAFFTNSTLGGHAMVLVHLDNLGGYGYYYYSDLTSYGLASGKWIIIEPQNGSLDEQQSNLRWISWWSIVACAEVPYGP
jgi:acyl carrier protein phosphodiesterase